MNTSTSPRLLKRLLSRALDSGGLLRADLAARGCGTVIAVNYHGTSARHASHLERHLAFYREQFVPLVEDGLLAFLSSSHRPARPGLVLCFDDGLRDNAEIAAPLLEKFGLRGWFMLPGGFLDEPVASQAEYFRANIRPEHPLGEPAPAMTWAMARSLAQRGHVIGCHTWSHRPLGPEASAETIHEEVDRAKERIEDRLGGPVRTFAWARGKAGDYSATAHRALAGRFDLAFTSMSRAIHAGDDPLALHRFNVEASFPLSVVRFQMSRFNELAFARRRREVEARIRAD